MKKKKKNLKNFFFFLVISSIVIFVFGVASLFLLLRKPISKEIFIQIPKNSSSTMIVRVFNEKGLLRPKEFFLPLLRLYLIVSGDIIHSGTYRFDSSNTNLSVLRSILCGRQMSIVSVTFPEGITIADFAHIAQEKLGVDSMSFVEETRKAKYREALGIDGTSIEGYLHPDTYFFYYMESPSIIIERVIEQQNKIWNKKFEQLARKKGLSRHFVLTLASIIEAESPLPEEKPLISGVYFNRLRIGMRLESDPTVQYALGGVKRRLSFEDLKIDSPYNTYIYEGLPPTPINSPGVASIEAVLNRAQHNYLFFVAVGDGSGRHYFAKTYSEHIRLKQKFKSNRKLSSLKK